VCDVVGIRSGLSREKEARTLSTVGRYRYPSARQRIEAKLIHPRWNPSSLPVGLTLITCCKATAGTQRGCASSAGFPAAKLPAVSTPAYDLLLVAHVLAALVGLGAIAAAGVAASSGRGSPDPVSDESVRRFFKPGPDWPARAIYLVPLLGLALLFGGDRGDAHAAWPWIGLGLWIVAAGLATGVTWPAERNAQNALAELRGAPPETSRALLWQFRESCRRIEVAAGAISVCFVAAIVVMIVQP
jgi:hypothetical protein